MVPERERLDRLGQIIVEFNTGTEGEAETSPVSRRGLPEMVLSERTKKVSSIVSVIATQNRTRLR